MIYKSSLLFWFGILVLFLSCLRCSDVSNKVEEYLILREEFGGIWSASMSDGCFVFTIIESERFDSNPDSIDFYLDRVEEITKNFKVNDCINLEHKIVRQTGAIKKEEAHLYMIRAK